MDPKRWERVDTQDPEVEPALTKRGEIVAKICRNSKISPSLLLQMINLERGPDPFSQSPQIGEFQSTQPVPYHRQPVSWVSQGTAVSRVRAPNMSTSSSAEPVAVLPDMAEDTEDMAQLSVLGRGNYLGLYRWTQRNHKGPHKWEGGRRVREGDTVTDVEVGAMRSLALKVEGSQEPRNVGSRWERQEHGFSPRPSGRMTALLALEFSSVRTMLDFWPSELSNNKFCCLKPLKSVVLCYSSHRKWISKPGSFQFFLIFTGIFSNCKQSLSLVLTLNNTLFSITQVIFEYT